MVRDSGGGPPALLEIKLDEKNGAYLLRWRVDGIVKVKYLPVEFTKLQAEVREEAEDQDEDGRRRHEKTVRTFPEFLHGFKNDDGEQVIGYLG